MCVKVYIIIDRKTKTDNDDGSYDGNVNDAISPRTKQWISLSMHVSCSFTLQMKYFTTHTPIEPKRIFAQQIRHENQPKNKQGMTSEKNL